MSKKKTTKAKEVKPKVEPLKELVFFNGEIPNKHRQIIERPDYQIILVRGDDEKTISELTNTGRILGVTHYGTSTANDGDDELIYTVAK